MGMRSASCPWWAGRVSSGLDVEGGPCCYIVVVVVSMLNHQPDQVAMV